MPIQESVREDGLRVITKTMPHTRRVMVSVNAKSGSADDPAGKEGLHHFFEHMAFQGTHTLPERELSQRMRRYFLKQNAATGILNTHYWGEGVHRNQGVITGTLLDIYMNSTYPEAAIESEKGVVLEEIESRQANPTEASIRALMQALCKHNPVVKFGAGTPETVMGLTRDDLQTTHKQIHIPSNTLVLGVGRIDHQTLVDQAFSTMPIDSRKAPVSGPWDSEVFLPPFKTEVVVDRPGTTRTYVTIGCKLPPGEEIESEALVLSYIIGKGANSMLFRELRMKGLVYSVGGMIVGTQHSLGYFMAFIAETSPEKARSVKEIMHQTISNTPLTVAAFEQDVETLRDHLEIGFEKTEQWEKLLRRRALDENGSLAALNRYEARRRRKLAALTLDQTLEYRTRFLTPERLATVILGPQ